VEFVVPIEWVGDETVVQQVGVHDARNLRGMPLLDVSVVRISGGAKLPTRVQSSGRWFGRCEWQRSEEKKEERGKYGSTETATGSRPGRNHK
jgi:hypothetical protein